MRTRDLGSVVFLIILTSPHCACNWCIIPQFISQKFGNVSISQETSSCHRKTVWILQQTWLLSLCSAFLVSPKSQFYFITFNNVLQTQIVSTRRLYLSNTDSLLQSSWDSVINNPYVFHDVLTPFFCSASITLFRSSSW